jgi:Spy/CpxP family protein refolding chaperone
LLRARRQVMLGPSADAAGRREASGPRRNPAECESPPREETLMRSRHWSWHRFDPAYAHGCGAGAERWAERMEARALRFAQRFEEDSLFGAAGLGVRRPLRFLAYKLDLTDEQTSRLARILERLKLERAQAALDLRRAASDLADAVEAERFERGAVDAAGQRRAEAARRVEEAVARALEELHALLEPEQRAGLAELMRTGAIRI